MKATNNELENLNSVDVEKIVAAVIEKVMKNNR